MGTAYADYDPRDRGKREKCDQIKFEPFAYCGFGEAVRYLAICYGEIFLSIQAITSLANEPRKLYA
jgi:hypothetical protein